MFTNWLTYRAVAQALDDALRGAVIREIFTQQKNELVIACEGHGESQVLQFSTEPRFPWLLLKPDFARARKNSLDLFPDTLGDRIESVRIAQTDRIIRMALASGRHLLAFLFPVRANLILIDGSGSVLERFKQHDPPTTAAWMDLAYENTLPVIGAKQLLDAASSHVEATMYEILRAVRPWLTG
ncbi:MAG: NFACT family protein, partial [Bacteroidetes bacterium]|nr:NFACT family protein [Bacteroidota bacterium]